MKRVNVLSENISPNQRRLRLKELSGQVLTDNEKKRISEVVSTTQPPKYHNRMKPQSSTMRSLDDMEDDEEVDLEEILDEMGYYDEEEEFEMGDSTEDDVREYVSDLVRSQFHENMGDIPNISDDELESILKDLEDDDVNEINFSSKGYKEGRKLVDKLRRDLFRKLDDNELDDFMDVLSDSFGLIKR